MVLTLVSTGVRAMPGLGEPVTLLAHSLNGDRAALTDAAGRRHLILLWSPDSLASRKSVGEIQRFADSPDALSVHLMAVSIEGTPASVRDFMVARGLTFPVVIRGDDNLGRIDPDRLPIALLVDSNGKLLRLRAGLLNLKALRELLDRPGG